MDKDSRPRIDLAIVEDTKSPPPCFQKQISPAGTLATDRGNVMGYLLVCITAFRIAGSAVPPGDEAAGSKNQEPAPRH